MNFMQNNQTPSTENSQSSESFPSMPQNNSSMFRNSPNSSSGPQTPSNDDVETQFPNFLLKLKTSHWNEESILKKKPQTFFFLLKRIHILLVYGIMFQHILLLVMVKQETIFG